jgi:monofunctional glycosyltransferase
MSMRGAMVAAGVVVALTLLPAAVLRVADPPVTALMLLRAREGGERPAVPWEWRPLAQIAPALRRAAVAGEDLNFCDHDWGFDGPAIRQQLDVWWAGGRPTGASTIVMQTARTLFLWPERGLVRKALEAWLTWPIALLWPRDRQLEVYLNVAEFGCDIFGVEAAARHWFGISAAEVSDEQAAALIALLPAPHARSPLHPTAAQAAHEDAIRALLAGDDDRLACAD